MRACPICGVEVAPCDRYPRYVCANCARKAESPDGRPLSFGHVGLSGGYSAWFTDDGMPYQGHDCVIEGVRCRADEARFVGIVIQAC